MESIYYEVAILINKKLYEEQIIPYDKYIKVEKELLKEIN